MKEAFSTPLQGHDAPRTIAQIVSFQAIHYLILATFLPPLLAIFSGDNTTLLFEGGPTQVALIFDWRKIAALPTTTLSAATSTSNTDWSSTIAKESGENKQGKGEMDLQTLTSWNLDNVWLDQPHPGLTAPGYILDHEQVLRLTSAPSADSSNPSTNSSSSSPSSTPLPKGAIRHWHDFQSSTSLNRISWTVILVWILSIPIDIILLVYLVRRPTHMLDHVLTFHFIHLLFSVWYTDWSIPNNFWWWFTIASHSSVCIIGSEQKSIKRELARGVGYNLVGNGSGDDEDHYSTTTGSGIGTSGATQNDLHEEDERNHLIFDSSSHLNNTSSKSFNNKPARKSYKEAEEKIELKEF